jgi:hypothetical protein
MGEAKENQLVGRRVGPGFSCCLPPEVCRLVLLKLLPALEAPAVGPQKRRILSWKALGSLTERNLFRSMVCRGVRNAEKGGTVLVGEPSFTVKDRDAPVEFPGNEIGDLFRVVAE